VDVFKRMLQATSGQGRSPASAEESKPGLTTPIISEPPRTEPVPKVENAKLAAFEEIYTRSNFKSIMGAKEYNILKVADMASSEQLHGLSAGAKHSALMMALEAAGVEVEDILQDAMQRQRSLEAYEEDQQRRLQEFESAKLRDNQQLAAEMESITAQYRAKIAAGVDEIERERTAFRDWQERKLREQRRLAEAASLCVIDSNAVSSEASVTRLLEKNATTLRHSA
jgi:hypothetical protein